MPSERGKEKERERKRERMREREKERKKERKRERKKERERKKKKTTKPDLKKCFFFILTPGARVTSVSWRMRLFDWGASLYVLFRFSNDCRQVCVALSLKCVT